MKKKQGAAEAERRLSMQAESMSIYPHMHKGMTCYRCGATDCAIVPNVDKTFKALQGVGASQHAMVCSEQCSGPWEPCGGCEEAARGLGRAHVFYCEVEHPGYREQWEKTHDRELMRLTYMVAIRGELLPAFIMDVLFPGFEHAAPPSFAAFKTRATGG